MPATPTEKEPTHYALWDAPGRRVVAAICGAYIRRTAHDNDPTCPACKRLLAYREAQRIE
jgi:hypothetical protein